MKYTLMLLGSLALFCFSHAQSRHLAKSAIDTAELSKKAIEIITENIKISSFGKYVSYNIIDPIHNNSALYIKSTNCNWQRIYSNAGQCYFSVYENLAVFQEEDNLHFIKLDKEQSDVEIGIKSFKINFSGKYLAYQEKGEGARLILFNLANQTKLNLGKVKDYRFDSTGDKLLLTTESGNGVDTVMKLILVHVNSNMQHTIWRGESRDSISNLQFDENGDKLAFLAINKRNITDASIWLYRQGDSTAECKLKGDNKAIERGFSIKTESLTFSKNSNWIFFDLVNLKKSVPLLAKDNNAVMVDVWGGRDKERSRISPSQLPIEMSAAINAGTGDFHYIVKDQHEYYSLMPRNVTGDFIILSKPDYSRRADPRKNFSYPLSYCQVSLAGGNEKMLTKHASDSFSVAPNGQWLVYFDETLGAYISHDIKSSKSYNLTSSLGSSVLTDYPGGLENDGFSAVGIAGWIKNNNHILIYNNYDLLELDPTGQVKSVNLTRSYGAKNHIKLRLINELPKDYQFGDTLLLTGFNVNNKHNGFFRLVLGNQNKLKKLYMGRYLFYREISQRPMMGHEFNHGMKPIKASKANCWIVERQTASSAPNLFFTTDFKHFNP